MVFSKYLFTTIAGLTGGVNAWAFTSSGGAVVSNELKTASETLDINSSQNDGLIGKENARLTEEKTNSEKKFKQLEDKNKETQGKASERKKSGESLNSEDRKLRRKRETQNTELKNKKTQLETQLKTSNNQLKSTFEEKVQSAFKSVQEKVKEETDKLDTALKTLQQSNQKLINDLKQCLEKMPQAIFNPQQDWCPETAQYRKAS